MGRLRSPLDLRQLVRFVGRELLPTGRSPDLVADGEAGNVRPLDDGQTGATHRCTDLGSSGVAGTPLQPGPLAGADGDGNGSAQDFVVSRLRDRALGQGEVGGGQLILGHRGDDHLLILLFRHGSSIATIGRPMPASPVMTNPGQGWVVAIR